MASGRLFTTASKDGIPMKQLTLLLMLCFSINAAAQTTGEIFGTVVTQDNEALPGVLINATSPSLEEDRSSVSSENGNFILRMLPPGSYTLTATMAGMQENKSNIEVTLLAPARTTIVMVPEEVPE